MGGDRRRVVGEDLCTGIAAALIPYACGSVRATSLRHIRDDARLEGRDHEVDSFSGAAGRTARLVLITPVEPRRL